MTAKTKMLTFFQDPGLRRGDRVPRVLYDDMGNRTLGKHWPSVECYSYSYPVRAGSEHHLTVANNEAHLRVGERKP
jgi:hypothetical protein